MSTSAEIFRWSGSFIVVVAAHLGAVAMTLDWSAPPLAQDSPNPAPIMLELAPLPAAPEPVSVEAPPGPELSEVVPEPEPPPPVEIPPMPLAQLSTAESAVPPRRPVEPVEKKPEKRPPSPAAAPPVSRQPALAAAAPSMEAMPRPDSAALPTWKSLLVRHLERHKRYPPEAQRARQEGIAYVRFIVARDGRILVASIERGTGVPSLDKEGLDLLRRAEPLPPLPADQPGETVALIVPIQFAMRR
jgi:protein TonB